MEFEKEIKTTRPIKNEIGKAVLNTMFTGNVFQNQTMEALKPYNINDQHYNILRILKGRYPGCACPSDIKEVLVNKRGDLTRLLDKLVKMNLVNRETNAENRRMIDVTITQKGLDLLIELDPLIETVNLKENLSVEEAKQLNFLLDKLRG